MNIDTSQALVVLVGAFNTLILRDPAWIKKYLFPESSQSSFDFKFNLDLSTDSITSLVEIDGIQIEVKPGRLAITPKETSQEYIDHVYGFLNNLSRNLPHTPMAAYGINFGFIGESSKSLLLRRKSFSGCLMGHNNKNQALELKQELQCDEFIIHFSISEKKTTDKNYEERLLFNFHTSANSIVSLGDLIQKKKIEQFQKIAQEHAEKVLVSNTEA